MITINENAKTSEILVACFLSEYYFCTDVIVGDGNKTPDITAFDKSFSVEVVICELEALHKYHSLKKQHNWSESHILTFSYDSTYNINIERFKNIIGKKIQKLKEGYYENAAYPVYLAVDSMMGAFDKFDIQSLLQALATQEHACFKAILWLTRDSIFEVTSTQCKLIASFTPQSFYSQIVKFEKVTGHIFSEYK